MRNRSAAQKASPAVSYQRVGNVDAQYATYLSKADRQFAIMAFVILSAGFTALYYAHNFFHTTHAASFARAAHQERQASLPGMNSVSGGQQHMNVLAQHMLDDGHEQLLEGNYVAAVTTIMSALELRPTHEYAIHCHFGLAQALQAMGEPFVPSDEGLPDEFVGEVAATEDNAGEMLLRRVRTGVKMGATWHRKTATGGPIVDGQRYTMLSFNGSYAFLTGGVLMKNLLPAFDINSGIDYGHKYNASFHRSIAMALGAEYGVPLQVVDKEKHYWAAAAVDSPQLRH